MSAHGSIRSTSALILAFLGVLHAPGVAQTSVWNGTQSSAWSNPLNWTGGIPDATRDVVIPALAPNVCNTSGASAVCRDLTVAVGATLRIVAGSPLSIHGNCSQNGLLQGGGLARFVGSGFQHLSITPGSAMDSLEFASTGTVEIDDVWVNGSVTMTSGTLKVSGNSNIVGTATFSGGQMIAGTASLGLPQFTFQNNVVFSGTVVNAQLVFVAQRNWTSDANFTPTSGSGVVFNGGVTQTVSCGASRFYHAGVLLNTTVDVVAGPMTLAGGFINFGALTPSSTLRFVGPFSALPPQPQPLPNVEVASASAFTFQGDVVIQGTFTHTAGSIFVDSPAEIDFNGTATFSGGSIAGVDPVLSRFNFNSDVVFNGTSVTAGQPLIAAFGNFSADANFSATGGLIAFLKPGTATIALNGAVLGFAGIASFTTADVVGGPLDVRNGITGGGSFTPGDVVRLVGPAVQVQVDGSLPDLVVSGTASLNSDLVCNGTCTVAAGGTLTVGARQLTVSGSSCSIQGTLDVQAGGSLALGPATSASVASTGTLRTVGALGTPAVVKAATTPGYGLSIQGTLAAEHATFRDMGVAGVVVQASATLAPAPQDLRACRFDFGAGTAGAVLLDIQRPSATTLSYLDFGNGGGTPNNVRCLAGAPITFANWTGALGGAAFEIDPGNRLGWAASVVTQLAFSATPGRERVSVAWTTSSEVDAVAFFLEVGPTATGPWTQIYTVPATGPRGYNFLHAPVVGGATYFYRLLQSLTHGPVVQLASGSACPWSAATPTNVLTVGAGGTYANIGAALAVINSATETVISVGAGTYPAFTVSDLPGIHVSVRILADGTGPVVIDTSAGPLSFGAFNFYDRIEIAGLTIGSPSSAHPAIVMNGTQPSCIILDHCAIVGGIGQAGASLLSSRRIAFQSCTISGTPGILGRGDSMFVVSRGTLDTLDIADIVYARSCQVAFGSTIGGAAQLDSYSGTMPDLVAPRFQQLGAAFSMTLATAPSAQWYLGVAPTIDWYDVPQSIAGWQEAMVGLVFIVSPDQIVASGVDNGSGLVNLNLMLPPDKLLLGKPIPFQAATFDPATQLWRFSNVHSVVAMP